MFYLTFPYIFYTIKYTEIKNFHLCLCLCNLPINFRKVSHQSIHLPPFPDSSRVTSYKGNEHNAESVLLVCISLPDQAHPVQHQFSLTSFKTDRQSVWIKSESRVHWVGKLPCTQQRESKAVGNFPKVNAQSFLFRHSTLSVQTYHVLLLQNTNTGMCRMRDKRG